MIPTNQPALPRAQEPRNEGESISQGIEEGRTHMTMGGSAQTDKLIHEETDCIETSVLLELHVRITIPTLLNNAEAWILQAHEVKELEQIELNCLKSLFHLPIGTPSSSTHLE